MMKKVCILMILLVAAFTVLTACKGGSNNNTTVTPTGAPTSYYHRCGGEITLGEYKGLKATQQKTVVSEADIDAEIAGLLATQPNYEKDPTRDGTLVKEGDALNIDYAGKIAGVAFDGGTAQDYFLVIGSNKFIEGFESSLIGKKVGETVDINVTFPSSYPNNPDLAGAAAVFTVSINYVGTQVDEITDAYVTRYFSKIAKNVAELREYARKELQAKADDKAEALAKNSIIDQAIANAQYGSIDQADVDYFYDLSLASIRNYAQMYGQSEETIFNSIYGSSYGTYTEFKEQAKLHAEASVKQYMLLQAVAEAEKITLTDEEFKKAVEGYMEMNNVSDYNQFLASYGEDYLSYLALCDKTLLFIYDNAEITIE
jgi:trigger factor